MTPSKTPGRVAGLAAVTVLMVGCTDRERPTAPENELSRAVFDLSGGEVAWGTVHEEESLTHGPLTAASPPGNGQFVNGSFETGDYTGWTLWEGNTYHDPVCGTWGIIEDGQTVLRYQLMWDFYDGIFIPQESLYLPETFAASAGGYAAVQLQNCAEKHRLYQDVTIGANTLFSWDMKYTNHRGLFSPYQQLAVTIRNPSDDAILETLFLTVQGTTPLAIGMTTFTADLSAYAGQTVRIDVEMVTYEWFFHATFDNFHHWGEHVVPPVAADRDGDGLVCYRRIGSGNESPSSTVPRAVFIDDMRNGYGCPFGWTAYTVPGA